MATRQIIRAVGAMAVAAAGMTLAACGGSGGATGSGSAPAAGGGPVAVHSAGKVGIVLTDRAGDTLYTPAQEKSGAIRCGTACAAVWPPVTITAGATPPASVPGADGTFGVVTRPGGARQLTYDGAPLYRFTLDSGPGQSSGDNATDSFAGTAFTWHAVRPAGATAPTSAPAAGNQGGY